MKHLKDKPYFSIIELADILGVSRITVYNRIKAKKINAEMMGGSYLISHDEVSRILNQGITEEDKKKIKEAVNKTITEYGNVLKMLGKE